jgi:hypothetical protein
MSTSIGVKQECEMLMNEMLSLAEDMLRQFGEFYPYGGIYEVRRRNCSFRG